jgi:gamma-glutamyltranspeptidase/glutathione hydrolase
MKLVTPPAAHSELFGERGVCAGGHPCQAEAGARMFELGGNAVDAAVAAAFVGFVVEQVDCSLGGFAHVSLYDGRAGRLRTFDGYVRAPGNAREDMFSVEDEPASYYGHPQSDEARFGARAVAVPGAVRALCEAQEQCGELARPDVLAPAIEIAEAGVAVSMRDQVAVATLREHIERLPDTARWLMPDGRLPQASVQTPGDRLDTAALAATLRCIAEVGSAGFYEGAVARAIASAVQRLGGILSEEDLSSFRMRRDEERPARYGDLDVVTCHDHVAHQALGMIDEVVSLDPCGFAYRHLMAEILAVAFSDGIAHYADPERHPRIFEALRDPRYLAERRAAIRPDAALPRPVVPGDLAAWLSSSRGGGVGDALPSRAGTSQMVAVDRDGNVASICTALGWNFGSLVYVPEVGVMLNNGMSYFDPRPGRPASIAPGKMPMFGAPTVAMSEAGKGRLAVAGSGGYRIETGVLHTLMAHLDYGMSLERAITHPRVHSQGGPTYVDARIPLEVQQALREVGHEVVVLEEDLASFHFGRVCAAARHSDGTVSASAGPAHLTAVAAV